jgi:hypothetical protein
MAQEANATQTLSFSMAPLGSEVDSDVPIQTQQQRLEPKFV